MARKCDSNKLRMDLFNIQFPKFLFSKTITIASF
ncbi:MAG: hypothetical protein ACI942_002480, partial [Planctomycetota bacterium]